MLGMLLTMLLAVAVDEPAKADQPAGQSQELFAKEAFYKNQPGKEQDFTGVLRMEKGGGGIGIGRFNPYRLEMTVDGKKDVREVYIGGKPDLLRSYIDKRVKITGKAVELEVIGRVHREIWPARIEVLAEGKEDKKAGAGGKELKILARGTWRHVSANPNGPKKGEQFVIRRLNELTAQAPWNRLDAPQPVLEKMAQDDVCKMLKVEKIDWTRQMLVVVTAGVKPTGGYRIDITSVQQGDKEVVIHWSVTPPKGFATQAFTHPALIALVERGEGTPRFVQAAAPGRPIIRPPLEK